MASGLTATQIIDEALKLVGNTSLSTTAQVWLNNILDRLYEDFRWPFLEKVQSGSVGTGTTTTALNSDFTDIWTRYGFKIIDQTSGGVIALEPMFVETYDILDDPATTGTPQSVLFNLNDRTFRLYPLVDKAYDYSLRYKYKPARITNFGSTVTFPNDQLLIQAVYVQGLQHEDDDRYANELRILEAMVGRYKRGFNRSPLRTTNMSLRPSRFRGMESVR